MIGTLGSITFETSSDKINTFRDFKRQSKVRTAKHDVHMIKPVKEFIGLDLDRISFTMYFDVNLGINPKKEIEKAKELMEKGEALKLIIGGEIVGTGNYTIETINESWQYLDNKGKLLVAAIDIELEEYIEEITKVFSKTNKAAAKTSSNSASVKKKNVKTTSSYSPKRLSGSLAEY